MRPSNNLENKTLSDTYWKVQLVCMKLQAHSYLEPPLEYNQGLWYIKVYHELFNHLGSYRNTMQFQITAVLKGKTGKEIPESSRLVFLEKFLANNFGL